MIEAALKLGTNLVTTLADRPGWLVALLALLIVGLAIKLALSNPKFWDLLVGMQHKNRSRRV